MSPAPDPGPRAPSLERRREGGFPGRVRPRGESLAVRVAGAPHRQTCALGLARKEARRGPALPGSRPALLNQRVSLSLLFVPGRLTEILEKEQPWPRVPEPPRGASGGRRAEGCGGPKRAEGARGVQSPKTISQRLPLSAAVPLSAALTASAQRRAR